MSFLSDMMASGTLANGWGSYAVDEPIKARSKRGEWRLPGPPALISDEFLSSAVYLWHCDDIILKRVAKYEGIPERQSLCLFVTKEAFTDKVGFEIAKDAAREEGKHMAQVRLFSGPEPILSSGNRKSKRLHREATRLYKWKKKWAEKQG